MRVLTLAVLLGVAALDLNAQPFSGHGLIIEDTTTAVKVAANLILTTGTTTKADYDLALLDLAQDLSDLGIDWVAVKAVDGDRIMPQFNDQLVSAFKQKHVALYGYHVLVTSMDDNSEKFRVIAEAGAASNIIAKYELPGWLIMPSDHYYASAKAGHKQQPKRDSVNMYLSGIKDAVDVVGTKLGYSPTLKRETGNSDTEEDGNVYGHEGSGHYKGHLYKKDKDVINQRFFAQGGGPVISAILPRVFWGRAVPRPLVDGSDFDRYYAEWTSDNRMPMIVPIGQVDPDANQMNAFYALLLRRGSENVGGVALWSYETAPKLVRQAFVNSPFKN